MQASYDEALRRLLLHEGGYTNHPSDPGGPTNFGITIFDYRKYVKPTATAADVRAMKIEEAKRIYRAKYWDAQRCDELPAGVDYAVFDYGVNSGIRRSGKVLRRVLKLSDSTSLVNGGVIAAAKNVDAKALIGTICDERLRFLQSLKIWGVFGKGWSRRVAEVRAAAFGMVLSAKSAPVPMPTEPTAGKAEVPLAKSTQQTSAGAIAAGGGVAAQQAHQSGASAGIIIAIVAAAIVAAGAAWMFWWWRQARQQQAAA